MSLLEKIEIKGTPLSPYVRLDSKNGSIEMSGRSALSDTETFFKSIIEWIDEYIKNPQPATAFICKFEYFNNPFSKILYSTFRKMDQSICPPNKLEIQWFYQKDDDEIKEKAEDITLTIKNATVKFIEMNHSSNKKNMNNKRPPIFFVSSTYYNINEL